MAYVLRVLAAEPALYRAHLAALFDASVHRRPHSYLSVHTGFWFEA